MDNKDISELTKGLQAAFEKSISGERNTTVGQSVINSMLIFNSVQPKNGKIFKNNSTHNLFQRNAQKAQQVLITFNEFKEHSKDFKISMVKDNLDPFVAAYMLFLKMLAKAKDRKNLFENDTDALYATTIFERLWGDRSILKSFFDNIGPEASKVIISELKKNKITQQNANFLDSELQSNTNINAIDGETESERKDLWEAIELKNSIQNIYNMEGIIPTEIKIKNNLPDFDSFQNSVFLKQHLILRNRHAKKKQCSQFFFCYLKW